MVSGNDKIETVVEAPPEPEIQPKTFWGILKNLFVIYGKGFLKFAIPIGIIEGIMIGIALWIKHSGFHVHTEAAAFGMAMLIIFIYYILYVLASGLLINTTASFNMNGKSSIRDSILILWRRLAWLLGTLGLFGLVGVSFSILFFLFGFLYIIGLVLFFIAIFPVFVYLVVKWRFVFEAVMIEGRRPVEAFSRSSALVSGYWWRTFGIILFIGIISGGIDFVLNYAFKFTPEYSQLIAAVIAVPIGIIGNTLLYYDLRARSEHCTVKQAMVELEPGKKKPVDSTPTLPS